MCLSSCGFFAAEWGTGQKENEAPAFLRLG